MVETSSVDRRVEARRESDLGAVVILQDGERICAKVVDLSPAGCQLQLSKPGDLPQTFDLEFRDNAYICNRRWAHGSSVGVQFVDMRLRAARKVVAG